MIYMKKAIITASVAILTLASCNNDANDGDATTDTMNTTGAVPQSSAPYGDTAFDVNNDGTRTNLDMRTDVDSMTNNRRADSTGGTNYSGKGRGTGGQNAGNNGRNGSDQ